MSQANGNARITTHQPGVGTLQGLWLYLCAIAYRYLCEFIFFTFKIRDRKFWAAQKPDRIQSYAGLKHHVFLPKNHRPGQTHPVYILIHGVGFIIGSPAQDHAQARMLADKHNFVVVGVSYRRAPEYHFPTAIHDVAAVITELLNDKSLPIDTSKVVVGGFSAGASIALAVAQLPQLRDRIAALVPFQPLTDRTGTVRGEYPKTMPWGGMDDMEKTKTLSDWAFPTPGQDLRDKLISPYFASRSDIPQPLCMVTSGADMLCKEDYFTACKLAGRKPDGDLVSPWEENGVKYYCARDMPHGFTHFWVVLKDKEWRAKQLKAQDETWAEVTAWLDKVLYSDNKVKTNGHR